MPINNIPHIHNLVMGTNVFVRKDGKYLLLKRSPKKKWAANVTHPIGGKIDPNENPFTGAEREIFEEAGIRLKNMKLEAVILELKPMKNENENWLIFHFSADYYSGKIATTEEGEFILLNKEEIVEQELFPSVRLIIDHILNPQDGTVFATVAYDANGDVDKSRTVINVCNL